MKRILLLVSALLCIQINLGAQAQITTKKVKIEDFSEKVTKIVLSGNIFFDSDIKEAVRENWSISPYEFCSVDDFNRLKTSPDYYFLIKVKGQFRREKEPGIEFLSLVKGGPGAEKGIDGMLELITFPYAAADSPSGRETVFLPLVLDVIQQHVLSSIVELNPISDERKRLKDEISSTLACDSKSTKNDEAKMLRLGFEKAGDRQGTHLKFLYHGDPRYMTMISTSPSDVRAGNNKAREIIRRLFQ